MEAVSGGGRAEAGRSHPVPVGLEGSGTSEKGLDVSFALGLLAREVAVLVAAGMAIGLTAAFSLSGTLTSFLYEVSPNDGIAFVAAPLLLSIVTFAAAYAPARRASRIDPALTLRAD